MRGGIGVVLALVLSGCAGHAVVEEREASSYSVDRRLLVPESGAADGSVNAYTLAASEGFRMPRPVQVPSPQLPQDPRQASLPATTVCVQVILDATGQVQRSEPLLGHSACAAGADPANQRLLQAAQAATARWTFVPAARCHFPAGVSPRAADDCSGATRIEEVPVTLAYAFTFEVIEGRTVVRSQSGVR